MGGTTVRLIIVMMVMALFSACSSVMLSKPLPVTLMQSDQACFEGVWLHDNESLTLKFTKDGSGRLAGVDWKDERFTIVRGEFNVAHVRNCEGFMSMRLEEDGKWPEHYYFARYQSSDQGVLLIYPPKPEAFTALVEAKKLAGQIKKTGHSVDVVLTETPGNMFTFLTMHDPSTLFESSDPIIMKKVSSKK